MMHTVTIVPYVRDTSWGPNDEMIDRLRHALSPVDVVAHADVTAEQLGAVRVAIVDGPSAQQLATMPGLVFVQSTWAGVDAVLPAVPDGVAIARMVDPQLGVTMAEAVLAWTLYLHRDMPRYARQQRDREWRELAMVKARERRVGVVGLGSLGSLAATTLAVQDFDVAGWSRSPKSIDDVECFDGDVGLHQLLARSDIVINLLPDTPATVGLFDAHAFSAMPAGSSIVNFGRGPTIDDEALVAALDTGHIDHAVLDVFVDEPLPRDHVFWAHESVTVLPHISGPTSTDTAAVIAATNVRRFLDSGELPTDALVDRVRGY